MAEQKTKPTPASVDEFVKGLEDPARRRDCLALVGLMKKITKCEPKMWGTSMVGFGQFHYKYASGHEGDTFILGFSPRKAALTLYVCGGLQQEQEILKHLGKHKVGGGCLYIKSLEDVDVSILTKSLTATLKHRPLPAG